MKIINIFDAVYEGIATEFFKYYDNNINQINKFTNLNLLSTVILNDNHPADRLKIIKYLLHNGIDVNYTEPEYNRNVLHTMFFNFVQGSVKFYYDATKILIEYSADVNKTDKYNAIPLKYAITSPKLPTNELHNIYLLLLQNGSNYNLKDIFGKSCLDYSKEYTWRNEFINIVKEYENGKY